MSTGYVPRHMVGGSCAMGCSPCPSRMRRVSCRVSWAPLTRSSMPQCVDVLCTPLPNLNNAFPIKLVNQSTMDALHSCSKCSQVINRSMSASLLPTFSTPIIPSASIESTCTLASAYCTRQGGARTSASCMGSSPTSTQMRFEEVIVQRNVHKERPQIGGRGGGQDIHHMPTAVVGRRMPEESDPLLTCPTLMMTTILPFSIMPSILSLPPNLGRCAPTVHLLALTALDPPPVALEACAVSVSSRRANPG